MGNPTKDGGPAFPVELSYAGDGNPKGVQTTHTSAWATGMTLRDYLAAKALVGITSQDDEQLFSQREDKSQSLEDWLTQCATEMAVSAYRLADAMLAVREAKGGA